MASIDLPTLLAKKEADAFVNHTLHQPVDPEPIQKIEPRLVSTESRQVATETRFEAADKSPEVEAGVSALKQSK